MNKYVIREANEEDIPYLLRLIDQLSPPKPDESSNYRVLEEQFRAIRNNPDYYLCVCEHKQKLVATGMLLLQRGLAHQGRPQGHIENIVTDEKTRGQGLGKMIIQHLTKVARDRGCYKTVLVCSPKNTGFYEKCGLTPTGEVEMRQDL